MDVRKPVVAYCRVSTTEQKKRGYGIKIQIRDVARFGKREGFAIRRIYKDEAESGVAEDRKNLRRLIRDCKRGAADMPTYDSQNRKEVLVRHIREAIAEDNRKEIIERLLKGRQERVRRGLLRVETFPTATGETARGSRSSSRKRRWLKRSSPWLSQVGGLRP